MIADGAVPTLIERMKAGLVTAIAVDETTPVGAKLLVSDALSLIEVVVVDQRRIANSLERIAYALEGLVNK